MRLVLLLILGALAAAAVYGWRTNPDACKQLQPDFAKLGNDLVAACKSLSGKTGSSPGDQTTGPDARKELQPDLTKLGNDVVAIYTNPPSQLTVFAKDQTPDASSVAAPSTPPPPTPPSAAAVQAAAVLVPLGSWRPPASLPAQPNWTWNASDGNTYQNVVITKVDPETVTITHASGVAHLPMASLPPDIQKQLNYDPNVARAARADAERKAAHPYYRMSELDDARAVAAALHRPLAWICTFSNALNASSPEPGSDSELSQMAMSHLEQSNVIIIFLDGNDDLNRTLPVVRDEQFWKLDDGGPLPGGHHFYAPKIVFTDPDITKPLGRVSHTQMANSREAAIDAVTSNITLP